MYPINIDGADHDNVDGVFQVKFSELTLDMFRMLQTLEREPTSVAGEATGPGGAHGAGTIGGELYDASPGSQRTAVPGGFPENGDPRFHSTAAASSMSATCLRKDNPHKYLLYRPSLPQLLVFLASGFRELPPNGVMLLYISADGCFPVQQASVTPNAMGAMGGPTAAPIIGTMGGVGGTLKHAEEECDELMRNEMRIRGRVPDTLPNGYDHGGAATNNKRDAVMGELSAPLGAGTLPPIGATKRGTGTVVLREQHCLYPGDLFPFTRKVSLLVKPKQIANELAKNGRFVLFRLLIVRWSYEQDVVHTLMNLYAQCRCVVWIFSRFLSSWIRTIRMRSKTWLHVYLDSR